MSLVRLDRRTLGFARLARRVTDDPVWDLVAVLRHADADADADSPAVAAVARRCVPPAQWARWSPVAAAPALARALPLLRPETPSWVVLALASHKVRSPADARAALHDLALPRMSPASPFPAAHALPLLTLAAHALACFSLVSLLRPLTSRVLDLAPDTHAAFHFNMLLQAISLFDRSRLAADAAIDVLKHMQDRDLVLWPNTERVLIRDNFRSPQLLDYFRRRHASSPAKPYTAEAWLRAYASLGKVQPSAHYLHAIRKQCLDAGLPPPYTTEHAQGTAHKANTQYLRSMRDDRLSAFTHFHRLLKLDLDESRQPPHPDARKANIDIYDWTTALYAGAHDRSLSATALLDLFEATKKGTNAYKPTRATYTVVIQGLLWRNALEDAESLWDEFVSEVVDHRATDNEMRIDRKALCVGIDVLVQSGRTEEALYLLDEAVKRDIEQATTASTPRSDSPFLKVHPIHALLTALLRIRRPDAIFYIWTHLTSLYFVPPTNLMLRILLKAAIQASKMDGESVKGAMSWYMADNRLFKNKGGPIAPQADNASPHAAPTDPDRAPSPSRDPLAAHLVALFQTPTPSVVGIWAHRRATDVARSIFRGMIYGNWPTLLGATTSGVTRARARGGDSVFQELARVLAPDPGHFLPPGAVPLSDAPSSPSSPPPSHGEAHLGPPLPTVVPSESTFAAYVALLGLSSRADEIPEVLVWMRALGVVPKRETLAVALVFWMEVGLRGPVFEDGWGRRGARAAAGRPTTEYGALRAWIRDWVGEARAPGEEDVYAGIRRVKEMREGQSGR